MRHAHWLEPAASRDEVLNGRKTTTTARRLSRIHLPAAHRSKPPRIPAAVSARVPPTAQRLPLRSEPAETAWSSHALWSAADAGRVRRGARLAPFTALSLRLRSCTARPAHFIAGCTSSEREPTAAPSRSITDSGMAHVRRPWRVSSLRALVTGLDRGQSLNMSLSLRAVCPRSSSV